jgi:eukaryotic-like serine/threonine-protein kinase
MGEVYRARDTRLGREVALKLLPEEFSTNRDRLRRFEQEARTVSALNHPNIVTIHDVGVEDSVSYIAMELIEGRTLRELLRGGTLPLRRMLEIATHVADGLARAHQAGIVHRDIKPDNVMVSRDGVVKILDFGLAKRTFSPGAKGEEPTATVATEPGSVLGTVRYMSPEQATGKPVDFRTDQFSFGSVLYELATGKPAFSGETNVDTLSAILHAEPEPLARINPRVPPPMRWIIERCLAKDPASRYSSTEDLARDLAGVREHLSELSGEAVRPAARPNRRWLFFPTAGLLVAVLGLVAGALLDQRLRRVDPPSYRQLTFRSGEVGGARFAPDEQTIVYSANWERNPVEIFMHRLGNPESRPLLSGAGLFAISRSAELALGLNGHAVDVWIQSSTLARMGMVGVGAPREVLEDVSGADWSPDGRELSVIREARAMSSLEYPAGRVLFQRTGGYLSHPRVSRKGDLVGFIDHPMRSDNMGSVAVVDRAGKRRILSTPFSTIQGLAWSADGSEIWFTGAPTGRNQALYAVTLSGRQRLLSRVMGSMIMEDVAPSGRVLVVHDSFSEHVRALAPGEEKERDLTWLDLSLSRCISHDGRAVLLLESGEGGGEGNSVFLRKTDGSPAILLGNGAAQALSPDGKWAAAFTRQAGDPALVLYPTGAGETRSIPLPGLEPERADWMPDGKQILLSAGEAGHGVRLYLQSLSGGKPRIVGPGGYSTITSGAVSPDGRRAVVRGPGDKLFLYPLEGGELTSLPGLQSGDVPAGWDADGHHLYVMQSQDAIPRRVDRFDVRTGKRELWRELGPETGAVGVHVTPDGRSYVYSYVRKQVDLYLVEGLR